MFPKAKKLLAKETFAVSISVIQYPRYVVLWKEFMQFASIIVCLFFCKSSSFLQNKNSSIMLNKFWDRDLQPLQKFLPQKWRSAISDLWNFTVFMGSIQRNAQVLQKFILQCFMVMNPKLNSANKLSFTNNFFP